MKPLFDPDVWWHLASGRYILEHRVIPHIDPFSLTARGTEWINSYWLFDIFAYLLHSAVGVAGLILVHGLAVVLIVAIQEKRLREEGLSWAPALVAVLVIFIGGTPRAAPWVHYASLVSLFFVSLLIYFLSRWRRNGWDRTIWWAPVMFLVWANTHRGFVLGLVIAGCYALLAAGISFRERLRRGGWLAACGAVTLLNPYGWALFRMIRDDYAHSGERIVAWEAPDWEHVEIFWVCLVFTWIIFLADSLRRKKVSADHGAALAFLTSLATGRAFSIPFFMIVAVPYAAKTLWEWAQAYQVRAISFGRSNKAAVGAALLLALFGVVKTDVRGGVDWYFVPAEALDFIDLWNAPGPYYNDYLFGGYWMWRFAGDPPVFIDGRYPAVKGYQPLYAEINLVQRQGPAAWRGFLDKYSIQTALLRRPPKSLRPRYDLYMPSRDWALVYRDAAALVFVRRTPSTASLLRKHELRDGL